MIQEFVYIAKKRLEIYEFLSFSFLNTPSQELINLIRNNSEYLKELTIDKIDFLEGKSLDYFTQEYYDRFFVPTSKLFVPPYEAAIRNKKVKSGRVYYGKLDSQETFHVKACYEIVDFRVEELNGFQPLIENHYPDHIAFELAFLTSLVNFEILALEKGQVEKANRWKKLEKDFLEEHLTKWIRDYAILTKEKEEGLYSYLMGAAASWIDLDLEYLMEENQ
ncbi:TorD/DmsD family molecular chaperone [Tissierella praeacuta]|uniref:TorD/DmsD family molecular chaperone n=1 Tax=Tissierella praeacuta TaxID=43131 RepID=UPI0028B17A42|nr:molecular chaperone TorD family protein [Tissierella praeacuta]